MISHTQQIRSTATKVAMHWLDKASQLQPADRVAFMHDVGSQIYPMFERSVAQAFNAHRRQGVSEKQAMQRALVDALVPVIDPLPSGLGIMLDSARVAAANNVGGNNVGFSDMLGSGANTIISLIDSGVNAYSTVQQLKAADRAAAWQRNMDESEAEFRRRMQELELARAQADADAAAAAAAQAPSQPLVVAGSPASNVGLYIAVGAGVLGLLGFGYLATRK